MSDKEEYNVELKIYGETAEVKCGVDPVVAVLVAEEKCLKRSEAGNE